jgi:hypothetical protein
MKMLEEKKYSIKSCMTKAFLNIWYLQQVIKYLDAIIANNKVILDALSGEF